VLCGANLISEEIGETLETSDPSSMGTAKRVIITKDDCLILDGAGDKNAIKERADLIKQ